MVSAASFSLRHGEEGRLPGIEREAEVIGLAQVFLRAQVKDMGGTRQDGFQINRFFQGFVAAGLFQVLAHLIIHVALEGDELRAAGAEAVNPHARAGGQGDFGREGTELGVAASRAIPGRGGAEAAGGVPGDIAGTGRGRPAQAANGEARRGRGGGGEKLFQRALLAQFAVFIKRAGHTVAENGAGELLALLRAEEGGDFRRFAVREGVRGGEHQRGAG